MDIGFRHIRIDRPAAGVLRVELDRPDRRNAVDRVLLNELRQALDAPDDPVVILGSSTDEAFCAGGDLSLAAEELHVVSDGLYELYEHLLRLPNVLIVAADGHAVGGGAQLLLCADIRIGGRSLRASFLGARSGLAVGTWALAGLVGRGHALDLSLSGRAVAAEEAHRIGLVDRLTGDPRTAAVTLASELAAAAPEVLGTVRRLAVDRDLLVQAVRAERRANAGRRHMDAGSRAR